MFFIVSNMTLIPQHKTMSCWYACVSMLVQWRHKLSGGDFGMHDPAADQYAQAKLNENHGLKANAIPLMAKHLGLEIIPRGEVRGTDPNDKSRPAPAQIDAWLRKHGPLFVGGSGENTHGVVISGISGDLRQKDIWKSDAKVKVYDPAPQDIGKVHWLLLPALCDELQGNLDVALWMHCPRLTPWGLHSAGRVWDKRVKQFEVEQAKQKEKNKPLLDE